MASKCDGPLPALWYAFIHLFTAIESRMTKLVFFNTKLSTTAIVGLNSAFCASLVSADTYTWEDNRGVVNYSERVPKDVDPQKVRRVSDNTVRPSSTPAHALPAFTRSQKESSATASDENLSAEQQRMLADLQASEAQRTEQVARIRSDNCDRATRVLNNLSSVGGVRVVSDDGSQSVLPEDECSERISQAQRGVAANCGS